MIYSPSQGRRRVDQFVVVILDEGLRQTGQPMLRRDATQPRVVLGFSIGFGSIFGMIGWCQQLRLLNVHAPNVGFADALRRG